MQETTTVFRGLQVVLSEKTCATKAEANYGDNGMNEKKRVKDKIVAEEDAAGHQKEEEDKMR